MEQTQQKTTLPGEEDIPTLENIVKRMRDGSRLTAAGLVLTDAPGEACVDLALTLKVGKNETGIGTLVIPLCDYPLFAGMLCVGTVLMQMDFRYELIRGSAHWARPEKDAQGPATA